MPRRGALEPTVPSITLVGDRRCSSEPFHKGEWSQEVDVAGKRYRVRIARGRRVKIAYSSKWGNKWFGEIYDVAASKRVWDGEVPGSLGVRGMLIDAGIVDLPSRWWNRFLNGWHLIARAHHGACHPDCRKRRFDFGLYDDTDPRLARDHTVCGKACRQTCEHEWHHVDGYGEASRQEWCLRCDERRLRPEETRSVG